MQLRRAHPVFRQRRWFQGRKIRDVADMAWYRYDGVEMSDDDWNEGHAAPVGVFSERRPRDPRRHTARWWSTTASSSCSTPARPSSSGRCPRHAWRSSGSSSSTRGFGGHR
ncbi:MAG: hypothetical protein WKF58_18930 [Ilumatobacteraceae bacterium]